MTYPIICFNPPAHLESCADERAASGCTMTAVKKGFFQAGVYVDSDGKEFKVTQVELPTGATTLVGWLRRLTNPLIHVKLTFAETGQTISLDELRRRVLAELDRDPDFYIASGELAKVRGRVQRSQTRPDLISCFL